MRWIENFKRMRILDYKPEGRRDVGRPELRWLYDVREDFRKLVIEN